jgi:hypothetical protein
MITLYDSIHGHSKSVALKFDLNAIHVSHSPPLQGIVAFFCPTYGDEELPPEMDGFIYRIQTESLQYVLCELGNYFGQDDFEFGAARIIKTKLDSLGWSQIGRTLSLDSFPKIDWSAFYDWKNDIGSIIKRNNLCD